MATRLSYYSGDNDIYSQLMAQLEQEQPYYSYAPVSAGLLGGYDPSLYNRSARAAITGNYSGLLGSAGGVGAGGFGGPGMTSSPSGFANSNSITGGLLGALIGQQAPAPVTDLNTMTPAAIAEAIANMDAALGLSIGFGGDPADAGMAAADGVGASGIGEGIGSVSMGESIGADGPGSGGGADNGGDVGMGDAASAAADAVGVAGGDVGMGDGGGGGGGGACVIATHAVANGAFTPNEKRQAVKWCVKNLHRTWWGEAIRRGYRYYGRKAIEAGKAKNHYQEFRDYVAFATGTRKTPKTALTFAWRNVQFFVTGIFVKD